MDLFGVMIPGMFHRKLTFLQIKINNMIIIYLGVIIIAGAT